MVHGSRSGPSGSVTLGSVTYLVLPRCGHGRGSSKAGSQPERGCLNLALRLNWPVLARKHAWVAQGGTGKGKPWALYCLTSPVPPDTPGAPGAPGAPADSEPPSAPPELPITQRAWPGLDHLGAIQAGGGLSIGLIALFSSYDHITAFGRSIGLQQQWGVFFIVASVATVVTGCVQYGAPLGRDAQLATRSRLRAAQDAERMADEAARERDRAAEARERQRKSFERLDQAALLSARVQLDPSESNRARLRAFLSLMTQGLQDEAG